MIRSEIIRTETPSEAPATRGAGAGCLSDLLRPALVTLRRAGSGGGTGVALALLLAFVCAAPALAQCPAAWVPDAGIPGTDATVLALAMLPGGDAIVGGSFTNAGGVAASRIARYNPSTGAWSALGSGVNNYVTTLLVLPGGDVIAGGTFTTAGGVPANRIARYSWSTNTWSALGLGSDGVGGGTNPEVIALLLLPSGDLLAGGNFTNAGGASANYIARFNFTTQLWSPIGIGMNSWVLALSLLPGGDVIVGGQFGFAGGVSAGRIARYNPTTGAWSAIGTMSTWVHTLAVLPGGDLIAGGQFTTAGGVPANRIARYSPTTGMWSPLGSGMNGHVFSLAVLPGGDVIAGGSFNTAGGVAASDIARYNWDTGIWSALGSGTPLPVWSMVVLPGGDLLAGGGFTTAGGLPANRIARYSFGQPAPSIDTQPSPQTVCRNGTGIFSVTAEGTGQFNYQWQWQPAGDGTEWADLVEGINSEAGGQAVVEAVDVTTPTLRGRPLAGYINFSPRRLRAVVSNACASAMSNEATLSVCRADFNCDNAVNSADFFDFLVAFFSNNADFNNDGMTTSQDFFDFLAAFFTGC